jgi:GxxExxY protein
MEEKLFALGETIIGAAMRVHSRLGPGLLENAYEACLHHELVKAGLDFARQVNVPIRYDGLTLDVGYRLDMVVNGLAVVELKAAEKLQPIHSAQLISYLRLRGYPLGYLLNFNVMHMGDGIRRHVNKL